MPTLNGKPIFDHQTPFDELRANLVRFPIPRGLLKEKDNVLSMALTVKDKPPEVATDLENDVSTGGPPLVIHFLILKGAAPKP